MEAHVRKDSSLALWALVLSLFIAGCAEESASSRVDDATVIRDVIATSDNGCKSAVSDQLALIMLQQRYMGYGTQLPTTTVVPEPTSGGWVAYNPRVFPNAEPYQARGYLISACGALSYLRERTWGEPPFSFTFWSLSLSRTVEGSFGSGLLSSSWSRRDDRSYIITELTAGMLHEIWEGSDAATTVGTVSVFDAAGRYTSFEETWWLMCVRRGTNPNDVRLPEAWRPVVWREGQVARCNNEEGVAR